MPALGQEHGGIFPAETEPMMAVLVLEKVGTREGLSRQRKRNMWRCKQGGL